MPGTVKGCTGTRTRLRRAMWLAAVDSGYPDLHEWESFVSVRITFTVLVVTHHMFGCFQPSNRSGSRSVQEKAHGGWSER